MKNSEYGMVTVNSEYGMVTVDSEYGMVTVNSEIEGRRAFTKSTNENRENI